MSFVKVLSQHHDTLGLCLAHETLLCGLLVCTSRKLKRRLDQSSSASEWQMRTRACVALLNVTGMILHLSIQEPPLAPPLHYGRDIARNNHDVAVPLHA